MPAFSARITDGPLLQEWQDPAFGGVPSRLNAFPEHPHTRYVGAPGDTVEITATVNGVEGELDANLGGETFTVSFPELPGAVPIVTHPVGQSSKPSFPLGVAGHYTVRLKLTGGGGAIFFHIDRQQ